MSPPAAHASMIAESSAREAEPPGGVPSRPLVVDVDGTLVRTDLLHECALQFAARRPLDLWKLPVWLLHGRADLKDRLSAAVEIDPLALPLHDETVALIRKAQRDGRQVYLASASHRRLVEPLAARLDGIADVFATEAGVNLTGAAKADCLIERFGLGGFDYLGNSAADFPVWRAAADVLAVAASTGTERRILGSFARAEIIARPRVRPTDYLRALRPHQWAKNLLLFVPAITAHKSDLASLAMACLGFVAFCLAASSAYVLNDLLDLEADRAHPRKRLRPFAGARVPVSHGVVMAALLLVGAAGLGALASLKLLAVLGFYIAASLTYSFALKQQLIVDVIALSGLYTVRIFAGAAGIGTDISPWLLMFSLFLFLCLAIVKRCSELARAHERGTAKLAGRGYRVADLPAMTALAAAAGFGAVLIFTLYLSSPEVLQLYARPLRLWIATPVLLAWISRTILLANRGEIHDDPVVFALTDKFSLASGLCMLAIVFAAL